MSACGARDSGRIGEESDSLIQRLLSVDVTEVYSPPRVTREAKKYGPKAGEAWGLTEGGTLPKRTTEKGLARIGIMSHSCL